MGCFKDYFSTQATGYARYRPKYPHALFAHLATVSPGHDLACDCAAGSGQAARGLADHFERVIAGEPSAEQLAKAVKHGRIGYVRCTAEQIPIRNDAVDLVTVAQALHWFEADAFFSEVRRVLRPGGICAVWAYGLVTVAPIVDAVIGRFYRDVVGPFWPPERRRVETGYRELRFPFVELPAPAFRMQSDWTLGQLVGYLGTWSAVERYRERLEEDPLQRIEASLSAAWGAEDTVRRVSWPLAVRIGRKP